MYVTLTAQDVFDGQLDDLLDPVIVGIGAVDDLDFDKIPMTFLGADRHSTRVALQMTADLTENPDGSKVTMILHVDADTTVRIEYSDPTYQPKRMRKPARG